MDYVVLIILYVANISWALFISSLLNNFVNWLLFSHLLIFFHNKILNDLKIIIQKWFDSKNSSDKEAVAQS